MGCLQVVRCQLIPALVVTCMLMFSPSVLAATPMARLPAVGRHLHPSFARDRSMISAPATKGAFLSLPPGKKGQPVTPSALWVPLFPYELGAYVTTLTFGEGKNTQTVTGLVDTGSGILHFPCSGCSGDGCDKSIYSDLEFYDSNASASHAPVNCSDYLAPFLVYGTQGGSLNAMNCTWFLDQDSDGQIAGSLAFAGGNSANFVFFRDLTSIGYVQTPATLKPFEPLVACDFDASASSFGAGFSGIFGMNFQPGSLYSQVIDTYYFETEMSFCLGDGQGSDNHVISKHSGFLAFGAVKPAKAFPAKSKWTTPLAFTAGSGWYTSTSFINVGVVGLFVGVTAVLSPPAAAADAMPLYNFFLDTGTAVVSYPPALLTPLRKLLVAALKKVAKVASVQDLVDTDARIVVTYKNLSRALNNAEKDLLFPTIYFQFDGTGKVPFRPSSYLISGAGPTSPITDYIFVANAAASIGELYTGVLGNAWLNRMLIQVKQDISNGGGSVTMTLVDQCSAVTLVAA